MKNTLLRCYLDLETTGFSPDEDSIIEVAMVRENADGTETRYDALVTPERSPLNPTVTQITGITQAELDAHARPWSEVQKELAPLLENCVITGHNIGFDIGFLRSNGIDTPENNWIDTHALSRILLINEQSYSLEALATKWGLVHENAHRAMSDVLANQGVMQRLEHEIAQLPSAVLQALRPLLQAHGHWHASELFLAQEGTVGAPERPASTAPEPQVVTAAPLPADSPSWQPLQGGQAGANSIMACAQTVLEAGEKALIVTPKLRFFSGARQFPTAQVLLSGDRLDAFCAEPLDEDRLVFALKCRHRQAHGLRGLAHINLFFPEKSYWNSVHMAPDSAEYATVRDAKLTEPVLAISPLAYGQMWRHFTDRTLLIDEAEFCTKELLVSGTDRWSLWQKLETPETQSRAVYATGTLLKELVLPLLKREIGTYPERVPLPTDMSLAHWWPLIESLGGTAELQQILCDENPDLRRWVEYRPNSGELSFHWWRQSAWAELRTQIAQQPLHMWGRISPTASPFLGHWLGTKFALDTPQPSCPITLHSRVGQVRSPRFITDIAVRCAQIAANQQGCVITCSSRDFVEKLYKELLAQDLPQQLFAERVTGSDGKILGKIAALKEKYGAWIFIHHRALRPELEQLQPDVLIVPKFPFSAPNPLIEQLGQRTNLWDVFTVPFTGANLLRRVHQFGSVGQVHVLDPRATQGWGRGLMTMINAKT